MANVVAQKVEDEGAVKPGGRCATSQVDFNENFVKPVI